MCRGVKSVPHRSAAHRRQALACSGNPVPFPLPDGQQDGPQLDRLRSVTRRIRAAAKTSW